MDASFLATHSLCDGFFFRSLSLLATCALTPYMCEISRGKKELMSAAVLVEQAEMRQGVPESTSVFVQAWGRFVLRHAGLHGSCIAKDFIAGGLDEHSLRWVHSSMLAEGLFFVQVLGRWGSATIEKYVADAVAEKASWAPLAAAQDRDNPGGIGAEG